MAKELTKAQEARVPEYRDKWYKIGCDTKQLTPAQKTRIKTLIPAIYALKDHAPPTKGVKFFKSPKQAVKFIKSKGVSNPYSGIFYGNHEAGWLGFYDFFNEVVKVPEVKQLEPLIEMGNEAGAGWCWFFDEYAIICNRPTILSLVNERLHSEVGPAVAWSDGTKIYALNGVVMPAWLFETPKDEVDSKRVMALDNVEQRSEAIAYIGMERLYKDLLVNVIDKGTGNLAGYELLLLDVGTGRNEEYLKMVNPSTGEIHIECVGKGVTTVSEALLWRLPEALRPKDGLFKQPIARA